MLIPGRFEIVAWYAPSIGRYVKLVQNSYGGGGRGLDKDRMELTTYQRGGQPPANPVATK